MSGGVGPYGAATRIGTIYEFKRTRLANRTLTTHRDEMVEPGEINDGSGDWERNVVIGRPLADLHQTRLRDLDVLLIRIGRRGRSRRR